MVLSAFEGISKVTGQGKRDGATSADNKTPEVCLSDVTSEQRPDRKKKEVPYEDQREMYSRQRAAEVKVLRQK